MGESTPGETRETMLSLVNHPLGILQRFPWPSLTEHRFFNPSTSQIENVQKDDITRLGEMAKIFWACRKFLALTARQAWRPTLPSVFGCPSVFEAALPLKNRASSTARKLRDDRPHYRAGHLGSDGRGIHQ